ncbi:hypothetical protein ILUMI_00332 [Ignelater luminosus]|uniref:HTH psq-type domain-containing protein n=1 Tax=Ignelater luminosus TaxID=2038154 RepID=A0A8K0DHG0_IGNLU|nr:hypothetical protein ILUMI_00332 [Ignelater luminosus]
MPNTYIRKANAKPRGLWTSTDLQSAINEVKSGIMGVNKAAKSFNIPKTTLKYSSQPGPSGEQIAQNRTPEKSVLDISPGKALDLVSPVPVTYYSRCEESSPTNIRCSVFRLMHHQATKN